MTTLLIILDVFIFFVYMFIKVIDVHCMSVCME